MFGWMDKECLDAWIDEWKIRMVALNMISLMFQG